MVMFVDSVGGGDINEGSSVALPAFGEVLDITQRLRGVSCSQRSTKGADNEKSR